MNGIPPSLIDVSRKDLTADSTTEPIIAPATRLKIGWDAIGILEEAYVTKSIMGDITVMTTAAVMNGNLKQRDGVSRKVVDVANTMALTDWFATARRIIWDATGTREHVDAIASVKR